MNRDTVPKGFGIYIIGHRRLLAPLTEVPYRCGGNVAHQTFVMALAKFLVATAWADGKLSHAEINALKDLLFCLSDISGEEWTELEIYMDSPVSPAERTRLLKELIASLRSPAEKAWVKSVLEKVVAADGEVSGSEKKVLDEVQAAVEKADVGGLSRIKNLLNSSFSRRSRRFAEGPNREKDVEEFINNRIWFRLKRHLESEGKTVAVDAHEWEKLCLAGGLMARIAWVDEHISEDEKKAMAQRLEKWGLSPAGAELVTKIAASSVAKRLDYFRLTRTFFECTERHERVAFLDCLFAVANACGKTSFGEVEEIRTIAKGLKVDHAEFIEAKLRVSRQDRGGL